MGWVDLRLALIWACSGNAIYRGSLVAELQVLFGHKSSAAGTTRRNPTTTRSIPTRQERVLFDWIWEKEMTTILFLIFAVEVLAQFITAVGAAQINNLVSLVAKTQ